MDSDIYYQIVKLCEMEEDLSISKRELGVSDISIMWNKNVIELNFEKFKELFPLAEPIGHDEISFGVKYYYREEYKSMVFYSQIYMSNDD